MVRAIINQITRIFGHKEFRAVRELKKIETFTKDEITEMQLNKLNALICHFRTFPFYNKLLTEYNSPIGKITSMEQLKLFPVITKDIIMANLDYIASRPEAKLLNSTSGSTGKNFQFYQNNEMLIYRRAANIIHMGWIGVDYWKDRKLSVWGLSPATSRLREIVQYMKVAMQNGRLIQAYGLNEKRAMAVLKEICGYKPDCMTAYPGYAYELACIGQKNSIAPPKIKAIILSGEMVFEHQIKKIEDYFNCPVYNRYGSREFGPIAHPCEKRNSLHIHPARLYIETDEKGELLITDLTNYATPFIRYAIGDAGQVTFESCFCGRNYQSIINLYGRSHDIIKTKTGKQLPGQFWTTLSRSIPGIAEFQVVQNDIENIELKVVITPEYRTENECHLYHKLKSVAGSEINMKIIKVKHIELTPSGKRRFVIREETKNA